MAKCFKLKILGRKIAMEKYHETGGPLSVKLTPIQILPDNNFPSCDNNHPSCFKTSGKFVLIIEGQIHKRYLLTEKRIL